MKTLSKRIFLLAKPFLNIRKNYVHTKISFNYAIKLLKKEKGDKEIVIPAIILHDVGWKKVPKKIQFKAFGLKKQYKFTRFHEEEGVKIAEKILRKMNYNKEKINEILKIIEKHDTRKKAISFNDKLVKDADKLGRYSKTYQIL